MNSLLTTEQAGPVKLNVVWFFSNIVADGEHSFRNEILSRSKLIDFIDTMTCKISQPDRQTIPQNMLNCLPWLIRNLYSTGFTHITQKEPIVSQSMPSLVTSDALTYIVHVLHEAASRASHRRLLAIFLIQEVRPVSQRLQTNR
jgi:hypothetical protein